MLKLRPIINYFSFYRTQKAMWQAVAEAIPTAFSTLFTELQVQNKWKSLERAYKKTKMNNSSSGHSRAVCDHEE